MDTRLAVAVHTMNEDELDKEISANELAKEAGYSRAQFYRRHARESNEPPVRTRRRLLLERAAFELNNTNKSVTEIAFDARFESLEGFARAFRRAFGISSRRYRQLAVGEYRFDLTERIHFAPGTPRQGATQMDMTRTLVTEHFERLQVLVQAMDKMSDADLDASVVNAPSAFPWPCQPKSLRELTEQCFQHEPWLGAINDERPPASADWLGRVTWGREHFESLIAAVTRENLWELNFVDKDCQPPQVFSYGFIIQFTITNNIYHRVLLEGYLREMKLVE